MYADSQAASDIFSAAPECTTLAAHAGLPRQCARLEARFPLTATEPNP
jgi:hypothetical protein